QHERNLQPPTRPGCRTHAAEPLTEHASVGMAGVPFESVAEAQRLARKRLPKSVYLSLRAGTDAGMTVTDNTAAFAELGIAPYRRGLTEAPDQRLTFRHDLRTPLMGQELALPVLIAPTGVQAVHPGAEVAVARAAAKQGTAMALSHAASKPIEEVVAANPKT